MTKFSLWFNGVTLVFFAILEIMGVGIVHLYTSGGLVAALSGTSDSLILFMYLVYCLAAPAVNIVALLIAPSTRVTLSK